MDEEVIKNHLHWQEVWLPRIIYACVWLRSGKPRARQQNIQNIEKFHFLCYTFWTAKRGEVRADIFNDRK